MALLHFTLLCGDVMGFMAGKAFYHMFQWVCSEKDCPYWKQKGSDFPVGF